MIIGNGITLKIEFIKKFRPFSVVNEDLWTPAATENATIVWADYQT